LAVEEERGMAEWRNGGMAEWWNGGMRGADPGRVLSGAISCSFQSF
jgi:hypothetical protein